MSTKIFAKYFVFPYLWDTRYVYMCIKFRRRKTSLERYRKKDPRKYKTEQVKRMILNTLKKVCTRRSGEKVRKYRQNTYI